MITSYQPQGDGQLVERFYWILNSTLHKYVGKDLKNGDNCFPLLMVAYRSYVHDTSSTGETPSLLMLGRQVELRIDMLYGRNDTPKIPSDYYGEYVKS